MLINASQFFVSFVYILFKLCKYVIYLLQILNTEITL